MISRNYCRFDIRLFKECREHTDKYRVEKIFRLLEKSIIADTIYPANINEHDNYFEPKNTEERNFWVSCRELAKEDMFKLLKSIDSGKKSAEIRKQKKETPVVQQVPQPKEEKPARGSFIPPTEEEVVAYAKQMCELTPVMGGFMCSKDMVIDFFYHYDRQGWMLGNNVHMTNWKSALKKWCSENIKKMN